ncbi:MAG: asparagine synthase (glutamine-hydrolyzing) [Syntrophaceae bacterium]|nr:asparagine synthase (glutamine-hydrolyzing) [Syntrophaceae bacterium]
MAPVCGIVGNLGQDAIADMLLTMIKGLSLRGAIPAASFTTDHVGMGSSSWMSGRVRGQAIFNEDRSIVAVCDGEIYNWRDLFSLLHRNGHILTTVTTTEVLVHLYEEDEENFPLRCNGIFGAAIFDFKKNQLLLARDHLGCKALYYAKRNGLFLFASNLRGLLASNHIKAEVDPKAVNLYLANTCVPHPHTMFQGVFNVPPGHTIKFCEGDIEEHKYWDVDSISEDYSASPEEFQKQIRELVVDAIKIRILDDQRIGGVLSGGVDSSTIVSVLTQNISEPIEVFSIRYEEVEYDDSPLQDIMLQQYPLRNNAVVLKPEEVPDLLLKVLQNFDYPVNNASAMGTYRCFELAGKKVQIVFDGEAADELFCGGGGVVGEKFINRFSFIPEILRRLVFGSLGRSFYLDVPHPWAAYLRLIHRLGMPKHDRMLSWLPAFDRPSRRKLLSPPYRYFVDTEDEYASGRHYLKESKLRDTVNLYQYGACKTYLCNDLLYKNERMASAHGIINRTPFIDYRLAELAFRIPAKYKLPGLTERNTQKKYIYRKALNGIIPDAILWREKARGFSQPTSIWMRNQLKDFVTDTLLSSRTLDRGVFVREYLEKLLHQHLTGQIDHDRLLWAILTFELWMREHVDRK